MLKESLFPLRELILSLTLLRKVRLILKCCEGLRLNSSRIQMKWLLQLFSKSKIKTSRCWNNSILLMRTWNLLTKMKKRVLSHLQQRKQLTLLLKGLLAASQTMKITSFPIKESSLRSTLLTQLAEVASTRPRRSDIRT